MSKGDPSFSGGQGARTNVRNSSRVFGSSRKPPSIADVTVLALIFCTPRITIHMCLIEINNGIENKNPQKRN